MDGPDSVAVFGRDPAQRYPIEPASVVLRFQNGKGTILPAIPEFVTGLTFDGGDLVDVVYEPSDTSYRWSEYQNRRCSWRNAGPGAGAFTGPFGSKMASTWQTHYFFMLPKSA
jgi:hypothetical protein